MGDEDSCITEDLLDASRTYDWNSSGNHHHYCYQVVLRAQISLTLSLSIRPYCPSLPAGLSNYSLYPHRTDINKFLLMGQYWHVHVKESIEERHMNPSLLLQQCHACLVRLTWLFNRWEVSDRAAFVREVLLPGFVQYSSYHSFLVPVSLLLNAFLRVHVVHLYSSIDTTTAWKKSRFISSDRSAFYMIDSQSIVVPFGVNVQWHSKHRGLFNAKAILDP